MKNNTAAKSGKSAKSTNKRLRWPAGHPLAGQFANKELFAEYQKNLKLQKQREAKDRKNAKEREKRKQQRALEKKLLPTQSRSSRAGRAMKGWGSTSTARIQAGKIYRWHGIYTVSGLTDSQLKKVMAAAGSGQRRPTKNSDGTYTVTITPGFGNASKDTAFTEIDTDKTWLQDQAETWLNDLQKIAGNVEYHGSFYNFGRAKDK